MTETPPTPGVQRVRVSEIPGGDPRAAGYWIDPHGERDIKLYGLTAGEAVLSLLARSDRSAWHARARAGELELIDGPFWVVRESESLYQPTGPFGTLYAARMFSATCARDRRKLIAAARNPVEHPECPQWVLEESNGLGW